MRRLATRLARGAPWFAVMFALGGVNHVAALGWPRAGDDSSPARHALFVLVNAAFAAAFAARARWLLAPALLLAAQQTYSHGSDVLRAARSGVVDLPSLAVLVVLPFVVLAAWGLGPSSRRVTPRAGSTTS